MENDKAKPKLKIIDHPNKNTVWSVQNVDLGWAEVTIRSGEHLMTLANAVYILEAAKHCLMGVVHSDR